MRFHRRGVSCCIAQPPSPIYTIPSDRQHAFASSLFCLGELIHLRIQCDIQCQKRPRHGAVSTMAWGVVESEPMRWPVASTRRWPLEGNLNLASSFAWAIDGLKSVLDKNLRLMCHKLTCHAAWQCATTYTHLPHPGKRQQGTRRLATYVRGREI